MACGWNILLGTRPSGGPWGTIWTRLSCRLSGCEMGGWLTCWVPGAGRDREQGLYQSINESTSQSIQMKQNRKMVSGDLLCPQHPILLPGGGPFQAGLSLSWARLSEMHCRVSPAPSPGFWTSPSYLQPRAPQQVSLHLPPVPRGGPQRTHFRTLPCSCSSVSPTSSPRERPAQVLKRGPLRRGGPQTQTCALPTGSGDVAALMRLYLHYLASFPS